MSKYIDPRKAMNQAGVVVVFLELVISTFCLSVSFKYVKFLYSDCLSLVLAIGLVILIAVFFPPFLVSFTDNATKGYRSASTSLALVVVSILALICLFACFYKNGVIMCNNANTELNYFYLSVMTITTVGYGDCYPWDASTKLVACCEALIGYINLGLLVGSVSSIFKVSGRTQSLL